VARVAEGNEHALTQLYDGTNRLIYRLALRILRDSPSAEDVTLEVYAQVWRTAETYDPGRACPHGLLPSKMAVRARRERNQSMVRLRVKRNPPMSGLRT
jgi:hypothetical protein